MHAPPQAGPSPRELAARLPLRPGVYRFRDAAGHVLYLGRAVSLRRRVVSYWGDLRDRRHLTAMVARITRVEAVICDSAHEAAWLERNLLQRRKPPWNRSPDGGQEAEVWIRLTASGLRVVRHRPPGDKVRYFGPYLGGQKVRDAVSGLGRVLPLGHAVARRTGSERELAYARGALIGARGAAISVSGAPAGARGAPAGAGDDLIGLAAAVLDRDPAAVAAVRAELTARRDAAADRLGFEFAARVQAELAALDWITAEQKVTLAQPSDFDVHGWADGVLVCFEVRRGRLSGWSQRACGAAAARRHLDRTPSAWAGFARRSAELAARLR